MRADTSLPTLNVVPLGVWEANSGDILKSKTDGMLVFLTSGATLLCPHLVLALNILSYIQGVCCDRERSRPGFCFLCLRGGGGGGERREGLFEVGRGFI